MLSNVVEWVKQRYFRFPCEKRTGMLRDALEGSRRALDVRVLAADQLKEYTDEQRHQRAFN